MNNIKEMKVAFYVCNSNMPNIDYSRIVDANPGIAGSEYEFLFVPYLLEKRENGIDPYVLVNFDGKFPHKNIVKVNSLEDVCDYCIENGITEVVIDIKFFNDKILSRYGNRLKVIIWAHNNVPYHILDLVSSKPYFGKIVNCGREEMELYRDHLASLKSTYIYNIFPFREKSYYESLIDKKDNHNVVYMGSIIPVKGFHVLAKAWKSVVKNVPDAQLYVIGTGKLYNRNAILGKYGIAEKEYEDYFMQFLMDDRGRILNNVHFLGLLGEEKYEVLGKCKVAVPNPTGRSECLPITSIEMQLMGCGITTIYHPAYLDTVYNKDFLYNKFSQLANYIVKRLLSPKEEYDNLYSFISQKFGIDGNIQRWEKVITEIDFPMLEPISENNYQFKKLKDKLLRLKRDSRLLILLPPIEKFVNLKEKLIR